jgi:hypothetical protein
MRHLVGLELVCFNRSKHFAMNYEDGVWSDPSGDEARGLLDMACYVCSTSFYTQEDDAIGYCPNCGHVDAKQFEDREALVDFLRGLDFSWLETTGTAPITVKTVDGDWQLRFTRDPAMLQAQGTYAEVRAL